MQSKSNRAGYITLLELVVVLGVLGFLAVMLATAVARVREAAMRTESMNNLKQIVLAMHNAYSVHRTLPPVVGRYPSAAQQPISPHQTIFFHLLPYIEQDQLYHQGTKKDPAWRKIKRARIRTYISPQDASPPKGNLYKNWLATTNYAANAQLLGFSPGGSANLAAIPDGTSNTIAITERNQICSGHPNAWAYAAVYYWAPMFSYYSKAKFQQKPLASQCNPALPQGLGTGGILVALGDGSVRQVSASVSPYTWQLASDPNDGMPLPIDW